MSGEFDGGVLTDTATTSDQGTVDFGSPVTAPGPDPAGFDCRNGDFLSPGRRSPVPLACVLDPDCTQRMVVAHRGAGGDFGTIAPENGLAAIRAALILGVDGVELDIRHTADDGLVVIHDTTVDRTTDGEGVVSEMTLAEVTQLHLVSGPLVDPRGQFDCERVPTMADALALTRDALFVDLDVKTNRMDLVVAEIRRLDLVDQVFISVGSVQRAVEARALAPEIRVQIRPDDQVELDEHLALFTRPPEIVEIPPGQVEALRAQIESVGAKVFADVFGSDALAGITGDIEVYRGVYEQGAQILQSEFPQLVLQTLERWSPPPR